MKVCNVNIGMANVFRADSTSARVGKNINRDEEMVVVSMFSLYGKK